MSFKSTIGSLEYVINDDTDLNHESINYGPCGTNPRDYDIHPFCGGFGKSPFTKLIPREEWKERIEEMERTKTRLSDITAKLEVKNQRSSNFCWSFATVYCVEVIRELAGLEYVKLSPSSVACPITNYRNIGGWGTEALNYIIENGIVPQSMWPEVSFERKYNTEEAKIERLKYKVTEWYDIGNRNFDQVMSCLLLRIPLSGGFSWWRHQTALLDPVYLGPNSYGIRSRNSWGPSYGQNGYFILSGSKAVPDDACAPRVSVIK